MLGDHGLARAIEALAARLRCRSSSRRSRSVRPDVEATAYYIVAEALTNVAKHAEADGARVAIRRDGEMLRVEVADDGRGGADAAGGTGIVGLRDRAEAAGGTLDADQPAGPRHGRERGAAARRR